MPAAEYVRGVRMKAMMAGFSGWARMRETRNESVKVADTGITVVGTLLVVVTYMLVRG